MRKFPNPNAVPVQYHSKSHYTAEGLKGFSFGAPREAYNKVFMKTRPAIHDPTIPGPGKYDVSTFVDNLSNNSKNFTIFKKDQYIFRKYYSLEKTYISSQLPIISWAWNIY